MSSEVGTAADSGVVVRAVSEEDRASWRALYRGYRDFYKAPHSDEAIDTVWSWLHDEGHETRGLVALVDGVPLGLAHYRTFARPLSASHGLFLDDLFTSADARGRGVGSALLIAAERWLSVRRPDIATVVAEVLAGNVASQRLFAGCGFERMACRYRKRIRP